MCKKGRLRCELQDCVHDTSTENSNKQFVKDLITYIVQSARILILGNHKFYCDAQSYLRYYYK